MSSAGVVEMPSRSLPAEIGKTISLVLSITLLGFPTSGCEPTRSPTSAPATPISPVPATPTPALPISSPLLPSPTATVTTVAQTPTTSIVSATPIPFPPIVVLEPTFTGFQFPVYLTQAGEKSRLFVVEKLGRIQVIENGQVSSTAFLDIADRVGSQGNEQGLLSVAFPPDFATSGVFYVNYTDHYGDTVVARYRLQKDDPYQADPNSEEIILRIEQPAANHNGGQLQFGPDGYLYIGMGDGGRAGDPWGNAQNPQVLLGKMLRIEVSSTGPYRIPGDNPFAGGDDVRAEIWALGLRNPWRFSFDRLTGDLYIADVGQDRHEEVSFQPGGSPGGENYGWDVMEGGQCFEPATGCDPSGLVLPVAEYDHNWGCSITGGYVYRDARYPQMYGVYFFGDFCSGRIWGLWREPSDRWRTVLLLETEVNISSFGEDAAGELYVLGYGDGTIYRLVAVR